MKILTVIGARPQFVKAAIVSKRFKEKSNINEITIHTGQHYDRKMSQLFFDELEMASPNYNLGVGSGKHGEQTGKMIAGIEDILLKENPDFLLVYGDTNSTLAGSIAASKLHVPVIHIEAGLRSFNKKMPEEVNRVLTDHVSDLLFCPTSTAVTNLVHEGIVGDKVINCGDVMYDISLMISEKAQRKSGIISEYGLVGKEFALITIHRAENTDFVDRLKNILGGLDLLSKKIDLVWPVHPRTQKVVNENLELQKLAKNIKMVEPVGYIDMVELERSCSMVITDSGGVQKEAYFFKKPCVTVRSETEWIELINSGWNRLAEPNLEPEKLYKLFISSLESKGEDIQLYGAGDASIVIAENISQY